MTDKQQRFVEEYTTDWNGTQAAIRAGYGSAGARVEAHRLLTNANIRAAVAERARAIGEANDVSPERVLLELRRLAFYDPRKLFDQGNLRLPQDLDDDIAGAIVQVEVVTRKIGEGEVEYVNKYKLADKPAALQVLAKRCALLLPDMPKPGEEQPRRVIFEYEAVDAPSNKTGV